MVDVEQLTLQTPSSGAMHVRKLGAEGGQNLMILHRSIGGDSLTELVSRLAPQFSLCIPSLPGYDGSGLPEWARSPRDLATITLHSALSLTEDPPVLVGFGLGGWVAAEMAAMCPERLRALVLVAPLGVQPKIGEITDPFLVSTERYVEMGFARSESYRDTFGASYELGSESWIRREENREMTTRIAWKPRMFDQTLPFRLPYVTTPTLIVWGEQDAILPFNSVERYRDAIPGSDLVTLPGCGHLVECEVPDRVAELILGFAQNS